MSRETTQLKTKDGDLLHALVASVQDNLNGFRKHMAERGAIICEAGIPRGYYAEYSADKRELTAMYFDRPNIGILVGIHSEIGIVSVRTGSLLVVSGLEEKIVNQEAQELMEKIGESDDPESVQTYIRALYLSNNIWVR